MYDFKVEHLNNECERVTVYDQGTWESIVAKYNEAGLISVICLGKSN